MVLWPGAGQHRAMETSNDRALDPAAIAHLQQWVGRSETLTDDIAAAPLRYVGVFRNNSVSDIVTHATELSLSAVQLHGNETPEFVAELRAVLPAEIQIWKALRIEGTLPARDWPHVDRYVFDNGDGFTITIQNVLCGTMGVTCSKSLEIALSGRVQESLLLSSDGSYSVDPNKSAIKSE